VKEYKHTDAQSLVKEDTLYMKTFASKEDGDRYNMIIDIEKSDMEKFRLFCRMLRIGRMLASAKIDNR
jgi:hypothetical protein